ncbi:presequence protease, mitochondrial [Contarinia nasturtii]|uniref:presequence protease, mitochondrial n=1 Tax=Contarinia nasturtii TaxID=265458 RepID=UPI0012D3D785|nr:presequence protease, mitochondrial [Contarinia nasturtii]
MQLLSVCSNFNRVLARGWSKNVQIRSYSVVAAGKTIPTTTTKQKEKLKIGTTYHGFNCVESKFYPEYNMTAYSLTHEKLRTKFLHVDRNDNNNLFSINFRTPIYDSTGLPHILEHLALCGSKRYPVRDPFFKMINRSLATFMNAMTGPDYTLYPFSTTNEKDFRNLQKIYLDAVFNPNLRYIDFLQEGWRLENSDLNDIKSDINFKGVVFNEMKGAFATNNAIMGYAIMNNLLPNTTYSHISGGWPVDIPKLTWENLIEFHRKHYHPSNARVFSYGNFDVLPSLKYLNEEYFAGYEPLDASFSKVAPQERWSEPQEKEVTCRFDTIGAPIERQCQMAIGYVLADIKDSYEILLLNVLGELLVKGPNSSFYKTLIEPNVIAGASFGDSTGFDAQLKNTTFVVALQNINAKDFDLVEKVFDQTVDGVIQNGFDKDHVQSIINSIELGIKHQTSNFGLHLLFGLTASWNHDSDILNALDIGKHFENLKRDLADDGFLQRKVKEYFKDNKHRLTVKMRPDETYDDKLKKSEDELLTEKVSKLTEADREQLFQITNELAKEQKEIPSNTHLLPCLTMNDVSKDVEELNIQHVKLNKIPTQLTLVDTNGIVYARGVCHADHLSHEEILLLPLLTQVFAKMGTKSYDYRELDKMINLKTSGISFNLNFVDNISDVNKYEVGVQFGSYCLHENTGDMLNLIKELLLNFQLIDVQRFTVLLEEYIASLTADIAQTGHMYAVQGATSLITEALQLKAQLNGIRHIEYMKKLSADKKPDEILAQLQQTAQRLFSQCTMKYALNVSEWHKADVMKEFNQFTNDIKTCIDPNRIRAPKEIESKQLRRNADSITALHHVVNLPVNYCSKAILTVPYTSNKYASLQVLSRILTSKYLLPVVREQNGAYGAGAKLDMNGTFCFYSYRDPRSNETLDVFDNAVNWLRENWKTIDEQAIFEAKLSVLQGIDKPIAAGHKGMAEFNYGITTEIFSRHRNRIINTNKQKLEKVFESHLNTNESEFSCSGKCVLGPANENLQKDGNKWEINDFSSSE